jgi:hypothetical protein
MARRKGTPSPIFIECCGLDGTLHRTHRGEKKRHFGWRIEFRSDRLHLVRATGKPEVTPGQKPASRRSLSISDRPVYEDSTHLLSLAKADSALLRSSLFHHLCRFVSFSSGGLASARESFCRGLGSRWFTERFHRNALVTHFQYG